MESLKVKSFNAVLKYGQWNHVLLPLSLQTDLIDLNNSIHSSMSGNGFCDISAMYSNRFNVQWRDGSWDFVCFWRCLQIGYAEARKCVFYDDCATMGKSPEVAKQWHCKIEDNIFNQPLSKDDYRKQFKDMMNKQICLAIITSIAVDLLTKITS